MSVCKNLVMVYVVKLFAKKKFFKLLFEIMVFVWLEGFL